MICPECKIAGKKSQIFVGNTTSTLGHCPPFYDEKGVYHHHDNNRHKKQLSCTNGHRWEQLDENKCPGCNWRPK